MTTTDDRLALKSWRGKFFIECDCGTVSGADRDLVIAVWNLTPHFTPNAGIMCRDRATGYTVKISSN